jgi:hypothetical protein
MDEHKAHTLSRITAKFDVTRLVWFEIELIERFNPGWRDLSEVGDG